MPAAVPPLLVGTVVSELAGFLGPPVDARDESGGAAPDGAATWPTCSWRSTTGAWPRRRPSGCCPTTRCSTSCATSAAARAPHTIVNVAGVAVGLVDLRGRVARARTGGGARSPRARRCSWSPTRRPTRAGRQRGARGDAARARDRDGLCHRLRQPRRRAGRARLRRPERRRRRGRRRHRARRAVPRGAAGRATSRRAPSDVGVALDAPTRATNRASIAHLVNHVTAPLDEVEEVYEALVTGTRDYLRKNGFRSAVLGLSGGVDSSLVATIAVDAVGSRAVRGLAMPSRYSSAGSIDDAARARSATRHRGHDAADRGRPPGPRRDTGRGAGRRARRADRREPPAPDPRRAADGGVQRDRGHRAHDRQQVRAGDGLLDALRRLGRGVRGDQGRPQDDGLRAVPLPQRAGARADGDPAPVPSSVLDKPPSAELRPDQRDDQSLPPYEELDPLLELYVEGDATAEEIIARGYDPALVRRVAALVDRSEYKRRQMPPGVRISKKAFGRDRRMPITNALPPECPTTRTTATCVAHLGSCFAALLPRPGRVRAPLRRRRVGRRAYEASRAFGELALASRDAIDRPASRSTSSADVLGRARGRRPLGAPGAYCLAVVVGPRLLVSLRDAAKSSRARRGVAGRCVGRGRERDRRAIRRPGGRPLAGRDAATDRGPRGPREGAGRRRLRREFRLSGA